MQKRHSIMVSPKVYQELKKLKAQLLIERDVEARNFSEVIEYIVNYYKNRGEQKWK